MEGQKEEATPLTTEKTGVQEVVQGQENTQNIVNAKKWVEENFGKDNGNHTSLQQKGGNGTEERDRAHVDSPIKSTLNINQVEDLNPIDGKGEVANNLNTGSKEDHHSIARKHDNTQGENMMEEDKGGEEVQSQAKATGIDNGKEDHCLTSID